MCEEDDGDSGKLGKEMERAEGMCTNGSQLAEIWVMLHHVQHQVTAAPRPAVPRGHRCLK